jgi:N-acetylglutamate synthase-like GNAT family acetyltransferase
MIIRPLKEEDIDSCSKIVGENYSGKYANNSILEMGEMFGEALIKPEYVVAEENNKIIGFGGYIQSFMDYHVYQIFWINVIPENQGNGIGTNLVQTIIKKIKNINEKDKKPLVIQLTTTKPRFYEERFKFKIVSELKEGSYLMVLNV